VSYRPQMQITDQRGSSPAPGHRQVSEPYCYSRDPCPACVENATQSSRDCSTKQQLHRAMKVHVHSNCSGNSEENPRESCSENEEAHETGQNRSNPVKHTHGSICVSKCEKRSGDEADR